MNHFSWLAAVACFSVMSLWSTPTLAQFAKPADAIKYRQSALTLIGSHFGRMQPVMKGQAPYDAAQIKANEQMLNTLDELRWAAFGPGTEGEIGRAPGWVRAWRDVWISVGEVSCKNKKK